MQQLSISALCGVGAGVLSSLASQPGDTILSRINMAAKTGAVMHSLFILVAYLTLLLQDKVADLCLQSTLSLASVAYGSALERVVSSLV